MKINKRELILEESAKLFSEKGYNATSMKDIASALDIEAASLYNHIKSKQEILGVLLLSISERFHSGITDVDNSSYENKDKLKEIIKMHIRTVVENQNISSLILQDWKHLKEPYYTEFVEKRREYLSILKKIIAKAIESKELKKANPWVTLNFILSSLRWIYDDNAYDNNSNINVVELERNILDFVFKGIDID